MNPMAVEAPPGLEAPPLPPLPQSDASTSSGAPGAAGAPTPMKRKRGGNRKGSSNWKRREQNGHSPPPPHLTSLTAQPAHPTHTPPQLPSLTPLPFPSLLFPPLSAAPPLSLCVRCLASVLLDMLEAIPKFPSKLDDWNALCLQFNERTGAMGFPKREGKSLRKKWQVLSSSKGVEGEGLNEQEMRAKRLAQGEASLKLEESSKKQRLDGSFVSSSPLAPLPLSSTGSASDSSSSSSSSPAVPPVPLTRESMGAAVRSLRALLHSRQAEFERREYVWADWRRKDMEERERMKEVLEACINIEEEDGKTSPAGVAPGLLMRKR